MSFNVGCSTSQTPRSRLYIHSQVHSISPHHIHSYIRTHSKKKRHTLIVEVKMAEKGNTALYMNTVPVNNATASMVPPWVNASRSGELVKRKMLHKTSVASLYLFLPSHQSTCINRRCGHGNDFRIH